MAASWGRDDPVTDNRRRSQLENELLGVEHLTPEQEADAERIAAEKRLLRDEALVKLMGQKWFREFAMALLTEFGTFVPIHGETSIGFPDPQATFYNLGRRSAGDQIWTMLDGLSPDLAALMRREARTPKD